MNAWELLPAIRALYSRLSETRRLLPWELQQVLFSLGYTDEPEDERKIAPTERWRLPRRSFTRRAGREG